MTPKSAKAKGRRCAAEVKELLMLYAQDQLRPGDIEVTCAGVVGCDLKLSPAAREIYPFAVECKLVEALNIWSALTQAEGHAERDPGTIPVLFFRRNRSKLYVALSAEALMKLIR